MLCVCVQPLDIPATRVQSYLMSGSEGGRELYASILSFCAKLGRI